MDEMTAFDQQIAREVLREAGPSEPVDGAAILNDITATAGSHRWGFTMFSALKSLAAGAVVALLGGFVLMGILTTPQSDQAAPAAVSASPTAAVDAEQAGPSGVVISTTHTDGGPRMRTKEPGASYWKVENVVNNWRWVATDPRLSGEVTSTANWHDYSLPTQIQLEATEWTVVNDEGSWTGTGYGIGSPEAEFGDVATMILHGSEAYEGLTAFLSVDIAEEPDTVRGVIIADELPPFPEAVVPSE